MPQSDVLRPVVVGVVSVATFQALELLTVAAEARSDKDDTDDDIGADEGVEGFPEYKEPLGDVADEFCAGIRSGLSYCGGHTTEAARETAEFIRVEQAAKEREGAHGDHDWKTVVDD